MKTKAGILAIVSAALLVGVSVLPVQALDVGGVSIGGGSNGSTTASVGQGSTTATATLGGGTNVASATLGTSGTGLDVGIGGGSGSLVTTSSSDGTTYADVNLGLDSLGLSSVSSTLNGVTDTVGTTLGSTDVGDVTGGLGGAAGGLGGAAGGIGGDGVGVQVAAEFANYSGGQQQQLKVQCRSILTSPGAFDPNLVALCRMIAQIH